MYFRELREGSKNCRYVRVAVTFEEPQLSEHHDIVVVDGAQYTLAFGLT